jgi:hypothetical protein
MTFDIRRNPRVLAGEILGKIGAVDWTPYVGVIGLTAHRVLTNWSARTNQAGQNSCDARSADHVFGEYFYRPTSRRVIRLGKICLNHCVLL